MTIAVLPRATAAAVINRAVSRGAWAVACTMLVLDIPGLLDVYSSRGLGDRVAVPLAGLVVMICVLATTAWHPVPWLVLLYLLVGGTCVIIYQLAILDADPSLQTEATYLLNRPAVAILLIGTVSASTLLGILWCTLGYVVSLAATIFAAELAGRPIVTGWGPTLIFATYLSAYLMLALIQRRQRRRVPDFAMMEEQTKRREAQRMLTRRTAAIVHDTVLGDLSFVVNAPDRLDDRARQQLRDDVATITSADWLTRQPDVTIGDRTEGYLRDHLAALVGEMQWRGLTVHVSGDSGTGIHSAVLAAAVIDAARTCLENVLGHSGVTVAEIVLGQDDGESTIMVIDEGSGFDPDAVPADRLGLRSSVIQRVEDVGGYVRLWSSPGNGTSVLISVPSVATPHAPRLGEIVLDDTDEGGVAVETTSDD